MQVLTVDVGTGTQDILLYDSQKTIENSFQMILPSPTVQLAQKVKAATREGRGLLIEGVLMGGGPVGWAVRDHAQAGYPVYSLPGPARTFDDDLSAVEAMGIRLISEDEAQGLRQGQSDLELIRLGDFDYQAIAENFRRFGVKFEPEVLALAVFDHGAAPPEISDRKFRFDYIGERLNAENHLAAFAFLDNSIPERLTRFAAVAESARQNFPTNKPLLLMDTGPAAALGTLDDPKVAAAAEGSAALITNLGNFHTLAFLVQRGYIVGTFEHHTGELQPGQLEKLLVRLAEGTLTNAEVFDSQGHGALYLAQPDEEATLLAVTGPRRGLLRDRSIKLDGELLHSYFAVPHGAMMLAGNFGLLRALQYRCPELALNLETAISGTLAPDW
jgi:uncharacterized protein (DUF1786 family)